MLNGRLQHTHGANQTPCGSGGFPPYTHHAPSVAPRVVTSSDVVLSTKATGDARQRHAPLPGCVRRAPSRAELHGLVCVGHSSDAEDRAEEVGGGHEAAAN